MRKLSKGAKPLVAPEGEVLQSRPLRQHDPAQPGLPFDPMPDRIEPCLALLRSTPPDHGGWAFEVKWDGYRLATHIERSRVRIITRGGHDWTHRFPMIAAAARELSVHTAILDGEAVVLREDGTSDFGALQRSLGGRGGKAASAEAILMAFDLLYLDGHDLTRFDLAFRRQLLEDLVPAGGGGAIRLSEEVEAGGADLLRHACAMGLEGIIAKKREQPYCSGRTGDWLKIKCVQSESFMIVGYERSSVARAGLGSLLLAGRRGKGWEYVGSVGTGFSHKVATTLRQELDSLLIQNPVVPLKGRNYVFTEPKLIAEIEFRGWTRDGHLRHPSYKGLREAADNATLFRMQTGRK